MRRTTLTLLLAVALLAGCSKNVTPPSQTNPPPSPKVEGVALADLDLLGAPAPSIQRIAPPEGNGPAPDLTDVALCSGTDGYAVTRGGAIEKSTDGGASWRLVYQLKGGRFSRVEVVGSQTVFAAAQTGCDPGPNCEGPQVLVRSVDGGQTWTVLQPQLPPLQMPTEMQATQAFPWLSFQFVSAEVGYAAGDLKENYLMRAPPLMVTRDGGRTWQTVKLPDGLSYTGGFAFVSPDRGYVTAVRGGSGEYLILATQDGGQSWKSLYSTKEYGLFAVDFPTAKDGYVGGGNNPKAEAQPRQVVLATHDGGATWSLVSRVEDRGSPVVQLHMISPTEGWANRGGCWSMGASGPCGGRLYFTRDGGESWTDSGHGVGRIRNVGQRAWAIDGNGATTLWRTADGGVTWSQLSRPDAVRVSQVRFLDRQLGFIGTNLGFFQTTDGGRSWSPYPVGAPFALGNWPVFLDRQTALGLHQWGLQRSTDGARTWQPVTVPLPDKTERISMPALAVMAPQAAGSPPESWLAMERLTCMNPDCPAFLIHSSDGGATWQPLQPGPPVQLRQMAFADSLHGVGLPWGNKLLLTADGGKHWTQQMAAKDLNLYQASYAGSRNHLWLAGTYSPGDYTSPGALLHSTDGGQHWVAWLAKGVMFQQIQFTTAQDGWAVADDGSGSGLLTTQDGGRTWTQVWPTLPGR